VIPLAEYMRYGDEAVDFYVKKEKDAKDAREKAAAHVYERPSDEEISAADQVPPIPAPEATVVVPRGTGHELGEMHHSGVVLVPGTPEAETARAQEAKRQDQPGPRERIEPNPGFESVEPKGKAPDDRDLVPGTRAAEKVRESVAKEQAEANEIPKAPRVTRRQPVSARKRAAAK
jgi:hypothetical protein